MPGDHRVSGATNDSAQHRRGRRFLDEYFAIDILAFGEGEITFRELVRAHLTGNGFHHVPGIAARDYITAPPGRVNDFTPTASPYLDGTFEELIHRHRDRFNMALCETNRGCPFSCTFCDWSLTKKVVEFPIERVFAELDWVVARRLADLRKSTGMPGTFYFYLTKNNHGRNLESIDILQGGGIPTFNELILGLPGQTDQSFARTIATAMPALPRHDFVLFLCRLIHNTELGDPESRERFGIQTRRCQWKTSTAGWDPIIDEYQEVVVGNE